MKLNPYIVGMIAACAFAALMAVFSRMGFLVLIPVFLGSLPIYVAALGWGSKAGITATLAIVAFAAIAADTSSGLLIAMTIAAPAALAGHQANLAQLSDDGEMVWYPLSRILFSITVLIAGAILVFGMMVDFDPAEIGPQFAEQVKAILPVVEGRKEISLDEMSVAFTRNLEILPFLLPSLWIGIHVINLLLGMKITRHFGVLARPHEDIAASLTLPPISLAIVLVSLIGMGFTSAPLSYGLAVVGGAMTMAFSIVGLAIMHQGTRGFSGRTPLLVLVYIMIVLIFFPVYLFSFAGIMKTARIARFNIRK